jgi:hypothetical protein
MLERSGTSWASNVLTVIASLPSVLLANPIGHVRIAIKKNAVAGKQFTRLGHDENKQHSRSESDGSNTIDLRMSYYSPREVSPSACDRPAWKAMYESRTATRAAITARITTAPWFEVNSSKRGGVWVTDGLFSLFASPQLLEPSFPSYSYPSKRDSGLNTAF